MNHTPIPPLGPHDVQMPNGRIRTYLGPKHPFANSAGWQYRYRLVVMQALGRKLHRSEHVHHLPPSPGVPGNRADDRLENLELLACEYHGRLHAFATLVHRWRLEDGTFAPGKLYETCDWPRHKAVLGPAAREAAQDP